MIERNAGRISIFYFDHYWWIIYLVVFGALLLSAYTVRPRPYCINGQVLRHDWAARFSHWFNATGILLLLYSGWELGFLGFPRRVVGTDAIRSMFNLHFVGAALFLLGAVFWLGNMFLDPKRLEQHAPYSGSLKDAVLHYLHLAGLVKMEGAPTGKYEASERLAFIPLTLLALFMGITGLIKMTAHVTYLPTPLLKFATATHDYSTFLLAVLLVFHIILAAAVPWAWPLLRSMITGFVPLEFVKKDHPKWYKELQEEGVCDAEQ